MLLGFAADSQERRSLRCLGISTYADFVTDVGFVVGSYVDADGIYQPYVRGPNGGLTSFNFPEAENLEYLFVPGANQTFIFVIRLKRVDDVPRTYVGGLQGLHEFQFPGSISTHDWNINLDGSVVGYYDSADGRRHGFIARPTAEAESHHFSNFYTVSLAKGLNMLSVPLAPPRPMTAKGLVAMTGATTLITINTTNQQFVAWTPGAPDDGFPIEDGAWLK